MRGRVTVGLELIGDRLTTLRTELNVRLRIDGQYR
jgi:hypothetical protein